MDIERQSLLAKICGNRLRSIRKEQGYTLAEFSKLVNISVNTLSSYERGTSLPNLLHLACLCQALYIVPSYLYFEFFNSNKLIYKELL